MTKTKKKAKKSISRTKKIEIKTREAKGEEKNLFERKILIQKRLDLTKLNTYITNLCDDVEYELELSDLTISRSTKDFLYRYFNENVINNISDEIKGRTTKENFYLASKKLASSLSENIISKEPSSKEIEEGDVKIAIVELKKEKIWPYNLLNLEAISN